MRQMKKKVNEADGLPITMPNEKFEQGVRDVIYYYDYKLEGNVELKNIFDVLTSDNDGDKVTLQDGSRENILPTKNLKITINPAEVLATKTVSSDMKDSIAPAIEWTYNQNYVTKAELAMFDILAHNNWKRPIYFAVTVPSENYIGLQKYLYNEGFAYRLLPLKPAVVDSTQQAPELLNTQAMYNNVVKKFKWGNMKNASYLDPESTRMIATIIKTFNTVAEKLIQEGKTEEAKITLKKALEVVPEKNYLFYFVLHKYYTADLLYKVNETAAANKLIEQTANYIEAELNYLGNISDNGPNLSSNDIQLGISVLNEMLKTTEANHQTALNQKLQNKFKALQTRFSAAGFQ